MRQRGDTRLGLTNQSTRTRRRTRVADNLAYLKRAVFGEARNGKVMRECEGLLKAFTSGRLASCWRRAFKKNVPSNRLSFITADRLRQTLANLMLHSVQGRIWLLWMTIQLLLLVALQTTLVLIDWLIYIFVIIIVCVIYFFVRLFILCY